jgi:hypothetical protein
VPPPPDGDLETLAASAPPMEGAEYLDARRLRELWGEMDAAFRQAREGARATLAEFLASFRGAWHLVGRVHFHLAEHRADPGAPFAFLATFTTGIATGGAAKHRPLGAAVRDSTDAADRDRLLALLLPVRRAAEACPWLAAMVEDGAIFRTVRWGAAEALRFLADIPRLEAAGVVVRVPAAWRAGRPPRPEVTATVGDRAPGGLGKDALLDFRVEVTLEGEPLTADEIAALLAGSDGLAMIRGRFVEMDRDRLRTTLERFREAERAARREGVSFAEAMRLVSGAASAAGPGDDAAPGWSRTVAGPWLEETLRALRDPARIGAVAAPPGLRATLRPYQETGVRWLRLLAGLRLGACLADDMGLGKTLQVIALVLARRSDGLPGPTLVVAPASLLANWHSELARFAPDLRVLVAHGSAMPAPEVRDLPPDRAAAADVVLTSYGTLLRAAWPEKVRWGLVVIDEAQAIKNPGTRQARAARRLPAEVRVALTGTPVENRLGDLWSIFEFLNPGLLGSAREFRAFAARMEAAEPPNFAPLRDLVRPYILRRMKTDPTVIDDLPAKTEVKAWCLLSRRQAALYSQAVKDLEAALRQADGIARRGVVLASLMRLKQICNHPSQWLGDGAYDEADSGKFSRLREIAEVVAARQEKALVFTQFREVAAPLASFLGGVFGRPGLVLHGGTPVGERRDLVRAFQEDERVPFFVLSLRAGGTGLNLTAATHVVHFDRWWNPAVEEQATDRAFRIGQKRNVLVHKFVCRGTAEERIDALIEGKRALARELLEGGADAAITEMSDGEILRLVALDLAAIDKEA